MLTRERLGRLGQRSLVGLVAVSVTLIPLGTEGYGRSETRPMLRDFFEVDAKFVTLGALTALARDGKLPASLPAQAIKDLGINPDKPNPLTA